jgi:hypothetical protein
MNRNDPQVRRRLRLVRQDFECSTGLRTYSIPWIQAGENDLFYAEAPWRDSGGQDDAVIAWLEKAEREGGKALDLDIRNTRMTVRFAD